MNVAAHMVAQYILWSCANLPASFMVWLSLSLLQPLISFLACLLIYKLYSHILFLPMNWLPFFQSVLVYSSIADNVYTCTSQYKVNVTAKYYINIQFCLYFTRLKFIMVCWVELLEFLVDTLPYHVGTNSFILAYSCTCTTPLKHLIL